MNVTWSAILWAGFMATTLAAACFWVFRTFAWTEFSPATQIGCLFLGNPRLPATEGVGFFVLFLVGSTAGAWVYAALLRGGEGPSLWKGALVGLVHGALVVALLPYLAKLSACVRSGFVPQPGRLGLRWGKGTPVGIVAGHLVYGAALGAILAAFATPAL